VIAMAKEEETSGFAAEVVEVIGRTGMTGEILRLRCASSKAGIKEG